MIRRLRRKFVLINMVMVGVVLLAALGLLIGFTVQRQNSTADGALNMALDMRPDMDEPRRFDFPENEDRLPLLTPDNRDPFFSSFCVQLDNDGNLINVMRRNLSLTDDDVINAVAAALQTGQNEGTLYRHLLSFRCIDTPTGTRIAFVDRSIDWQTLRTLIVICAAGFLLAMLALFAVSLYLSKWALKPAQLAWDQQRQFVADASHELKTPLTVILANTGLLLANANDSIAKQRRWVENTREEGLRMKKLVDDLLFLARSDADRSQILREPTNLSDAVWSAVLPFESVAFEKGLEMNADIVPDIEITANAQQIQQAVSVLMDNACKYASIGGKVTVTLHKNTGKAILSVHNTGDPIPQDALPHLFERFYRADSSRSRDIGGYGLGLSILDTIVHSHGGRIAVESSMQTGTTFTVSLPM